MAEFHRIIIDTDTAGDDAAALIIAAKNPNIEILGVTVLAGNVSLEQGAKHTTQSMAISFIRYMHCFWNLFM